MKSVSLAMRGQVPVLLSTDSPLPKPGRFELLIRVCAAGVTGTELGWYPTTHTPSGEPRSAAIPGHEFSGVVAALGQDVGSLELGREVYGMNDWYAEGATAEFCIAPFAAVAPKPAKLSHVEAASVPIGALTAWQGLFDRAKLQRGEKVLVHGGAGAVGNFAIQLAKRQGATVIATASAAHLDFVKSLGADQVLDYRASRFEDFAQGIDVVFDTAGGETLDRSWNVLGPQGRMVTIVSSAAQSDDPRVKQAFFIVEPDQKQLFAIADLLDTGQLRSIVDTVVPLTRAPEAYAGKVPRQGRGKIVVEMEAGVEGTTA